MFHQILLLNKSFFFLKASFHSIIDVWCKENVCVCVCVREREREGERERETMLKKGTPIHLIFPMKPVKQGKIEVSLNFTAWLLFMVFDGMKPNQTKLSRVSLMSYISPHYVAQEKLTEFLKWFKFEIYMNLYAMTKAFSNCSIPFSIITPLNSPWYTCNVTGNPT